MLLNFVYLAAGSGSSMPLSDKLGFLQTVKPPTPHFYAFMCIAAAAAAAANVGRRNAWNVQQLNESY